LLVKDAERIHWIADIAAMALGGDTVNTIVQWLTAKGAPVPGVRSTGDTTWSRQTVIGLLRNPVMAGMRPYNPGRGRMGGWVDPFSVVCNEFGEPVVDESLAVMTVDEFTKLQDMLVARDVPQARKKNERVATSPFLSRVVLCDDCGVYLCRGSNQGKPVLSCPRCRQTIGRTGLDPYLVRRLLEERGGEPLGDSTVQGRWSVVGLDEAARRNILLTQLAVLRIRRGVVGRYFDEERILLIWQPSMAVVS